MYIRTARLNVCSSMKFNLFCSLNTLSVVIIIIIIIFLFIFPFSSSSFPFITIDYEMTTIINLFSLVHILIQNEHFGKTFFLLLLLCFIQKATSIKVGRHPKSSLHTHSCRIAVPHERLERNSLQLEIVHLESGSIHRLVSRLSISIYTQVDSRGMRRIYLIGHCTIFLSLSLSCDGVPLDCHTDSRAER